MSMITILSVHLFTFNHEHSSYLQLPPGHSGQRLGNLPYTTKRSLHRCCTTVKLTVITLSSRLLPTFCRHNHLTVATKLYLHLWCFGIHVLHAERHDSHTQRIFLRLLLYSFHKSHASSMQRTHTVTRTQTHVSLQM